MNGLIARNLFQSKSPDGLIPRQAGGMPISRRVYNGETKLIIGCGNGPIDLDEEYRLMHLHEGAFTIDIRDV